MRLSTKAAAAAILGMAISGSVVPTASEAIVCNAENVCWHVRPHYNYRPEWGVVVHEDDWRWGPGDHYTWREHRGRGYWRNGVWIRF